MVSLLGFSVKYDQSERNLPKLNIAAINDGKIQNIICSAGEVSL